MPDETRGPLCAAEGCELPTYFTQPWCRKHYRKWRYDNDPAYREGKLALNRKWNKENSAYYTDHARKRIAAETEEQRARRLANIRNRHLRAKYGIGVDEYDRIWQEQGGVCAICGEPEARINRRTGLPDNLAVDHCAETGGIRGLLCTMCNRGIGALQHSPALLAAAIEHLESEWIFVAEP